MKASEPALLFDPAQFEQFGEQFYKDSQFSCRFQESKKLFWTARYVPLGPVTDSIEGLRAFLDYSITQRFTRIKVDLPLILSEKLQNQVCSMFLAYGYKRGEYVSDEETLLVTKSNFSLNSRNMRYVRQGLRDYRVEVVTSFTSEELKRIHELYTLSAVKIGFKPKSIEAFQKIAEQTITSIAYNRLDGCIEGFLMGYLIRTALDAGRLGLTHDSAEVLSLVFTGLSDKGRDSKLGFALHNELFNQAFTNHSIDIIDFHGASRSKGRSYVGFKQMFGGEFVSYPGSFDLVRFF